MPIKWCLQDKDLKRWLDKTIAPEISRLGGEAFVAWLDRNVQVAIDEALTDLAAARRGAGDRAARMVTLRRGLHRLLAAAYCKGTIKPGGTASTIFDIWRPMAKPRPVARAKKKTARRAK